MKGRIQQIMSRMQMKQNEFASALGISPSSLSSILNGHTSPTNNTVQAIHRRFPEISITWLMFGEGEMMPEGRNGQDVTVATETTTGDKAGSDQPKKEQQTQLFVTDDVPFETTPANAVQTSPMVVREIVKYIDKPQRKITEILVHYDDGTFESFPARKD